MVELIGLLLAAGAPRTISPRSSWPLHRALWELHEGLAHSGALPQLRARLQFRPNADVGRMAVGADEAVWHLHRGGILIARGSGRSARLEVDDEKLRLLRRDLLRLEPDGAEQLYRAGKIWATLEATSWKNRTSAASSTAAARSSSTPKRLQVSPTSTR